jgi:hypothetical protein
MLALSNKIHLDGRIIEQQKHGIEVCIPKTENPQKISRIETNYFAENRL